jgi:riboflavin transporter 2
MIGAVSQLAQLGPVLLFFAKCKCVACFSSSKLAKSLRRHSISDRFIIYTLFAIGLSAGSMLALFWDRTLFIMGQHRSVAFFSCVFCLAILDCTCTIVFLTYVGDFRGNYITALYIGEGISSLLPSFFALLQGTGDDNSSDSMEVNCINGTKKENNGTHEFPNMSPRFSVSAYFWLLFGTLVISFVAFVSLDLWPGFKKEKIGNHKKLKSTCSYVEKGEINQGQNMLLLAKNAKNDKIKKRNESLEKMILLIGITIVSFVLYGFIPGLSSYSALPYGHSIMHLCVTLGKLKDFSFTL